MKKIKIIIPCYNEEESINQLIDSLKVLKKKSENIFNSYFIFIDDGSKDQTYNQLQSSAHVLIDYKIIQHPQNLNLGAAIRTGIQNSDGCDYIAFLDSDCTYDPSIIIDMFLAAENGYQFVTVSPYHPKGMVEGVPQWRLLLSKTLSLMYRILFNKPLYTFTAMVRLIDSSIINKIISDKNDFSAVAEMIIKAIRLNIDIFEIPTTLKVRRFGTSKMNILKTILSHIKIIINIAKNKI
jgi:dolichol-phosphate mannosyltransferase